MTLLYILVATFAGGLLSVVIAASLTVGVLSKVVHHLVSLSTGVLLGTALLHVLPEAFESSASPHSLFLTLLAGLMFFFLLEKAELYRHGHHHENDHHHHHHGFDRHQAGRGGWSVLVGDSIHNFCDGIIIAAAFLTDMQLGIVTAAGHHRPRDPAGGGRLHRAAQRRPVAQEGAALQRGLGPRGGARRHRGLLRRGAVEQLFPYMLVIASSSFIYVAVADLIPQLQHRLPLRETLAQIAWLAVGADHHDADRGVAALRDTGTPTKIRELPRPATQSARASLHRSGRAADVPFVASPAPARCRPCCRPGPPRNPRW